MRFDAYIVGLGARAVLQRGGVEGGVADESRDRAQDENQRQASHELGLQRQIRGRLCGCSGFIADVVHKAPSGFIGRGPVSLEWQRPESA